MNILFYSKNVLRKIFETIQGITPEHERLHPDFLYGCADDGWTHNALMEGAKHSYPDRDSYKVRVLLNAEDRHKLNSCPFIAKLGHSIDTEHPLKFCAFLYPDNKKQTIEDVVSWVEARNFPNASVFTYGQNTAHGWKSDKVQSLSVQSP